jgi:hypothetical protein
MRSRIKERFRSRESRCNPQACGDYVPSLASVALVSLLAPVVLLCGCIAADAATLNISGHFAGHGFQNLSYAGDALNASFWQNGTGWDFILQSGGLP